MSLSERLKKVRASLGKSQKEMAAILGISYPAWQRYELGKNAPGSAVIEELVKLGYSANWMLAEKGDMMISPLNVLYNSINVAFGKRENRLLNRLHRLLNEYEKDDPCFSDDMAVTISSALFGILFRKDDSWLTDENINVVIKSLVDIYKAFDIYRKMNITGREIEDITSMIWDPEKWEIDMAKSALDALGKLSDEGEKGRSKKRK